MKILFLTNNLCGGGAERVLVNLANSLVERNYDVTVRALINAGENKSLLSSKVKYEYILKKAFRGINFLHVLPHKWIYNKVAYGEFDIVVVYLHGVLTKIVSYAPETQKTVAYLHANMEKSAFIDSFGGKENIRKCFNTYNRIVAVSEDVKESFINVSDITDKRLVVKYNTFDVERIQKLAAESFESRFENKKGLSVCTVGNLKEVKGHKRLLSVVKKLKEDGMPVQLTIVGGGSLKEELQAYINDNELREYATLIGFDVNPYKYVAKSDLFVCSSYSEGFSSVVAESLFLGVPVVTTDCAGMRELLGSNNEFGVIVSNDEEGLYKGISNMVKNPECLEKYRLAALERGKLFDTENTVSAVEEMFKEIMNE